MMKIFIKTLFYIFIFILCILIFLFLTAGTVEAMGPRNVVEPMEIEDTINLFKEGFRTDTPTYQPTATNLANALEKRGSSPPLRKGDFPEGAA